MEELAGFLFIVLSAFVGTCACQDSVCLKKMSRCASVFYSAQSIGIRDITTLMPLCSKYPEISACLDAVEGGDECRTRADDLKANIREVLVDSKLCDRHDEMKNYESCFSKPELLKETICDDSQATSNDICRTLDDLIVCWTQKVTEICGQAPADFVQFFMKVRSRNIAKNLNKSCPGLESVSSATSVWATWTGVLFVFVRILVN